MFERIVVVTKKTQLEDLLARHYSREQAEFFLNSRGNNIAEYEGAHIQYVRSLQIVVESLPETTPHHVVERAEIANFLFRPSDLVVVVGPDGLCANVAKYLPTQIMLTVNPDPERIDGKLMLFSPTQAKLLLPQVFKGQCDYNNLTLALAETNDGQKLVAVNDFLIGRRDQMSARYTLSSGCSTERQSSSGILVSTGVGSSGWLTSVATSLERLSGVRPRIGNQAVPFAWDTKQLAFVVREAFPSRYTSANLITGSISDMQPLIVTSEMPEGGVIFSDGVPEDAIEFNSGTVATIKLVPWQAKLVANPKQ